MLLQFTMLEPGHILDGKVLAFLRNGAEFISIIYVDLGSGICNPRSEKAETGYWGEPSLQESLST